MASVPKFPYYNPFDYRKGTLTAGLDYVAANIKDPNFDDIITAVLAYYASLPTPITGDAAAAIEIIIRSTANDYINGNIGRQLNFDAGGQALMRTVLWGVKNNSIDSLDMFLDGVLEQLTGATGVNSISKTSLYVALALATESNSYWNNVVDKPGSWAAFINSQQAINYANIPFWISATYMSSLSGFAQVQAPNIAEATEVNGQSRLHAVTGAVAVAIALTSAQVILKWAKRPKLIYPTRSPMIR